MMRLVFLAAVAMAIAGCGGSGSSEEAKAEKPVAQTPAQKTVLDDQLKALQKAKDMQKTVDDQAKANDKAIEDGGG
jgi:hypothetical protein